jgi:hypothetical protein
MVKKQNDGVRLDAFYAGAGDALGGKSMDEKRYGHPEYAYADYIEGFKSVNS